MSPSALYPLLQLLPYQSAFAANDSRFKIGLWARQTGKDHTASAEAVIDCLYHPGTTWIILAASERQALESLSKAKDWAEILKFQIDDYLEAPAHLPLAEAHSTSTEIRWSNGSRLLALPANPHTVRGYSANLILTEFAFHENADAIWRAIYPSISNPLRGGPKKLRIISTPNGLTNKFADLWLNAPSSAVVPTAGCTAVSAAPFGVPPNTPLLDSSPGDDAHTPPPSHRLPPTMTNKKCWMPHALRSPQSVNHFSYFFTKKRLPEGDSLMIWCSDQPDR